MDKGKKHKKQKKLDISFIVAVSGMIGAVLYQAGIILFLDSRALSPIFRKSLLSTGTLFIFFFSLWFILRWMVKENIIAKNFPSIEGFINEFTGSPKDIISREDVKKIRENELYIQELTEKLEERRIRAALVFQGTEKLSGLYEKDSIMDELVELLTSVLNITQLSILLMNKGGRLYTAFSHGRDHSKDDLIIADDSNFIGYAAATGEYIHKGKEMDALSVENMEKNNPFPCIFATSLIVNQQVIGVLSIGAFKEGKISFQDEEIDMMLAIAKALSEGIKNSDLLLLSQEEILDSQANHRELILKKKSISQLFKQRTGEDAIKRMTNNPKALNLGGKEYDATILFCQILNFRTFSSINNKEKFFIFLSQFHDVVSNIIANNEGLLERHDGEFTIAVWNLPLNQVGHQIRATTVAWRIHHELNILNESLKRTGLEPVKVSFCISTETISAGQVGDGTFFYYGLHGDYMETGLKLLAMSKEHDIPLIITESAFNEVKNMVDSRPLGALKMSKGNEILVHGVYSVKEDG